MSTITFLDEGLVVEAPEGTSLQDIIDASGADITFGCRMGSCGSCRVEVASGLEHASPQGPEERDYLEGLQAPPEHRLACLMTVHGDMGLRRAQG